MSTDYVKNFARIYYSNKNMKNSARVNSTVHSTYRSQYLSSPIVHDKNKRPKNYTGLAPQRL